MSRITGIYIIKNIVNGKVYIGQSVNILRRKQAHFNLLSKNKHNNMYLQRSFNKYGIENFEFKIIEECEKNRLYEREFYWVGFYNSSDFQFGYNCTAPPVDSEYYSLTNETKNKISKSHIKYSREDLTSYIEEFYYHHGKIPTVRDMDNNVNYPSSETFRSEFGSFKNLLDELGMFKYVDNKHLYYRKTLTKDDCVELVNDFIKLHGNFPENKHFKESSKHNLPSLSRLSILFGGIVNFRSVMGIVELKDELIEKEDALNKLKELFEQDGYITSRTIDKSKLTKSTSYYSRNFNSLEEAYELAGIYSKEIIYDMLEKFVNEYGRFPTKQEVSLPNKYRIPSPKIINRYFGDFENAKSLFKISKIDSNLIENEQALVALKNLYNKYGYVTSELISKDTNCKSVKFYCNRFGNLKNAIIEANIPEDKLIYKVS